MRALTDEEKQRVAENMRIVGWFSRHARRRAPHLDRDELEQHLSMTLVRAAMAWKPERGPWGPYALASVRNGVRNFFEVARATSSVIRVTSYGLGRTAPPTVSSLDQLCDDHGFDFEDRTAPEPSFAARDLAIIVAKARRSAAWKPEDGRRPRVVEDDIDDFLARQLGDVPVAELADRRGVSRQCIRKRFDGVRELLGQIARAS